jgi:hypothetical protein
MAFQFAYDLTGDGTTVAKDFSLDTAGNYGTGGLKKGDLVFLNAGLVRKTLAATTTGTSIGVAEGGEFTGLIAQGQPYAAVNSSFTASSINTTKNPNGVVKVRNNKATSVFKVPVKSGQTAATANVGSTYNVFVDANNDQQTDLSLQTVPHVKVIDFTADGKFVFVTLV